MNFAIKDVVTSGAIVALMTAGWNVHLTTSHFQKTHIISGV